MSIFTHKDVTEDVALECDVCVIGSGAGGAHVAARLASAGKRVVVLEAGSHRTSADFNMREQEMYAQLYQDGGNRATADASISILQGRTLGGSTVVNWTTSFRTPEHVTKWWAEHHGVRGLDQAALTPHWERVEARLGIAEAAPALMNANNLVLRDGARKLGWKSSPLRRNVRDCANTGYCGQGCPVDAKQSMLITLIPEAVDAGADVYANVRVDTLHSGADRRVTRVDGSVLDAATNLPTGAKVRVEAKLTVMCGGGINNPALLLRSEIGNTNGRVGKRTFLHPVCGTIATFDRRIDPFAGAPQSYASHHFAERGERMGFFLEAAPMLPMLSSTAMPGMGPELSANMAQLPMSNLIISLGIDGFDPADPDEGGTVTVHPDGRPKVDYKWTPRLEEAFREGTKACAKLQLAAGATRVASLHNRPVLLESEADLAQLDAADYGKLHHKVFSAHVMGGCVMGGDPRSSVVDSTLRHHEFDNLFIVDGSVFPTSLGVNPQLSIYGLASWASEHLIAAAG